MRKTDSRKCRVICARRRQEEQKQRKRAERGRESGCRTRSSSESKVDVCVCVCQSMRVIKCVRGLSVSFSLLTLQTLFMSHLTKFNSHTHTQAHIYHTSRERRVRERAQGEPQTCAVNFLITRVLKRPSEGEREGVTGRETGKYPFSPCCVPYAHCGVMAKGKGFQR